MREKFSENLSNPNLRLGMVTIASLSLDINCRNSIVKVLRGLQHIYMDPALCDDILNIVGKAINPEGKKANNNGRPGMDYWQVLVLASVRLGCNLSYDALHDLTHQHRALRVMLGFDDWSMNADELEVFTWNRIRSNVCKLSFEDINKVSELVVAAGHKLVPSAMEVVRGDSFVVGTCIHHPLDRRQLGDGIRKLIETCTVLSESYGLNGWRKHRVLTKRNKKLLRSLSLVRRSRKKGKESKLTDLYLEYFEFVEIIILRALETMESLIADFEEGLDESSIFSDLVYYLSATEYMRELTVRRVIDEEKIPNAEKIHSIFEPHTELINRGKQPNAIEFGHRVLVIEDSVGFICHNEVMDIGMLDKDVLCRAMENLQNRMGNQVRNASFDCGFYTAENQVRLGEIIAEPCLPAKGAKLAKAQRENSTVGWRAARDYHSGVESAINGLQSGNGLDRCRDKSFNGFKRYVALGALGRNLCTLGRILIGNEAEKAPAAYTKRKEVNF